MATVTRLPFGLDPADFSSSSPSIPEKIAERRHYRTIWISDVHLGTRGCKAELLAEFLAANSCDTLYLVGDIIDGWQLQRRWYWTPAQTHVVQEILRKVDDGTRVIYVPGNHDEFLRRHCGRTLRAQKGSALARRGLRPFCLTLAESRALACSEVDCAVT